MVSKVQERIYAEAAIKLLKVDWQLIDIPEPLDFEIRSIGSKFGLEIRQIFIDTEQNFGSQAKRQESQNVRVVRELVKRYYAIGGKPISAQFLGSLLSIEPKYFAAELAASAPSYPGKSKVQQLQGVKVFMKPLPLGWSRYSRWVYVDDRVGWLVPSTGTDLQQAVDRKQENLPLYKQKYDDIDLLLVADRTFNSGKLYSLGDLRVSNPGFRTIYFLSYPEAIQRVD